MAFTSMVLSVAGRMQGIISDWFINRGPFGVSVIRDFVDYEDDTVYDAGNGLYQDSDAEVRTPVSECSFNDSFR